MRLSLASDHAGFALKARLAERLRAAGHEVADLGCHGTDSVDYPDYAAKLAEDLRAHPESKGVLLCGSGIGVSIAANRFSHIRCALCQSVEAARLARRHNDANVLAMGARLVSEAEAEAMLDAFLATSFEGGRHEGRVAKLNRPCAEV